MHYWRGLHRAIAPKDCPDTLKELGTFTHKVSFETASNKFTLSRTNGKDKLEVGEILEWELVFPEDDGSTTAIVIPGLPLSYSFKLDGKRVEIATQIEGARLQPKEAWHRTPDPQEFPESSAIVLMEPSGMSSIAFQNMHSRSIFVKICRFEDAHEDRPEALGKVFCRPFELSPKAQLADGKYHIRVAAGHEWRGETYLFGPAGVYLRGSEAQVVRFKTDHTISYPAGSGGLEAVDQRHW